jgi:preprotein translocase subunit SecB
MEQLKKSKYNYNFQEVILLEAFYKRAAIIAPGDNNVDININIENNETANNDLIVYVTIDVTLTLNGERQAEFKVKTEGLFKSTGNNDPLDAETFANVNAPAMIFPYAREVISNLSVRGAMSPVILPPVNFVELSRTRRQHSKESH